MEVEGVEGAVEVEGGEGGEWRGGGVEVRVWRVEEVRWVYIPSRTRTRTRRQT